MNDTSWILLDTETNGLAPPVYVVEIAAQRMKGWAPDGPPFRCLINQNVNIPAEASRVNGYTREILERDGEAALDVYQDFRLYAGDLPLVSYNLKYDLDDVLSPEWARLGIPPIGKRGFCALDLARRLLDPVPAGNCKLQTLRQFYRLPERGAHTALGDVQTVIDLFTQVLRPIACKRGLLSWDALCQLTVKPWFPRRIPFGKFKGRDFRDACEDEAFRKWLEWLSASSKTRSAEMGHWYLAQLLVEQPDSEIEAGFLSGPAFDLPENVEPADTQVVVYANPDLEILRQLVAAARSRLADIQAEYTENRMAIESTQATLFGLLRSHYQKRDRLKLMLTYREKHLESLLHGDANETNDVVDEYQRAKAQSDTEYEQAAAEAQMHRELNEEEAHEVKMFWRKLVRLFHPDRYAQDEARREVYEQLTQAINRARDEGDIAMLREIANNPEGFILRQGWCSLDFSDAAELTQLRKLYESLQHDIMSVLDALAELRDSSEHELYMLCRDNQRLIQEVADEYALALEDEISRLGLKLVQVNQEIRIMNDATAI